MKKIFKQNISPLFKALDIPGNFVITTTDHTYEIDALEPCNNWLFPAFKAFQKLAADYKKQSRLINTFVTVGTGPGIDAIGASHILKPRSVTLTDIHPAVLPIAEKNFKKNKNSATIDTQILLGNLCAPLKKYGIAADLIYANLPNISLDDADSILSGQLTSTFFDVKILPACPTDLSKFLLCMQNGFLHDAYDTLAPNGSVIINLGGRVPLPLVKKMFTAAGYTYKELYNTFKVQSQPEWVLGGYARAEEKYKVSFDFYRYDKALEKVGKYLESDIISGAELKECLEPFRVSATEGLKHLIYDHERIGHVVHVLQGIKK